jgi:ketosteroid isomerase-like protein
MRDRLAQTTLMLVIALGAANADAQPWAPTPQFQVSSDLAVALRGKDVAKAVTLFAERAVLLPPRGETVSGRAEIEQFVKERLGEASLTVAIVSTGSSAIEDLGFDSGTYEITFTRPKGDIRKGRGTYLAIQRRTEGTWKIDRLMLGFAWESPSESATPTPAPAPAPAPPSPATPPAAGPPPGVRP